MLILLLYISAYAMVFSLLLYELLMYGIVCIECGPTNVFLYIKLKFLWKSRKLKRGTKKSLKQGLVDFIDWWKYG